MFCGRTGDRIKALILLLLQQSESLQLLSEQSSVIQKQNEQLIKQIESLKEQLAILTNHRFGRKTEVSSQIPGQLSLDFGDQAILNEAELAVAESEYSGRFYTACPVMETVDSGMMETAIPEMQNQ